MLVKKSVKIKLYNISIFFGRCGAFAWAAKHSSSSADHITGHHNILTPVVNWYTATLLDQNPGLRHVELGS